MRKIYGESGRIQYAFTREELEAIIGDAFCTATARAVAGERAGRSTEGLCDAVLDLETKFVFDILDGVSAKGNVA